MLHQVVLCSATLKADSHCQCWSCTSVLPSGRHCTSWQH